MDVVWNEYFIGNNSRLVSSHLARFELFFLSYMFLATILLTEFHLNFVQIFKTDCHSIRKQNGQKTMHAKRSTMCKIDKCHKSTNFQFKIELKWLKVNMKPWEIYRLQNEIFFFSEIKQMKWEKTNDPALGSVLLINFMVTIRIIAIIFFLLYFLLVTI